jgi:hypothetical protein
MARSILSFSVLNSAMIVAVSMWKSPFGRTL